MLEEWLKVVFLAVLEGITEFLPISSTGHLIVVARVIELNATYRGTFEIFIQLGAVIAVVVFYRSELLQQARTASTDTHVQAFWLKLFVAFLPAAVIGFVFSDWIDEYLFNSFNVAVALIAGGLLFIIVERWWPSPPEDKTRAEVLADAQNMTYRQALLIGIWQIAALFPGMSRSGMTIMGGMLSGVKRATVTLFTFYLAIPTLGAATLYTLIRDLDKIPPSDLIYLIVGAIVSGIVAYLSIGWLLHYISRHTFVAFGIYRIGLGLLILVLLAAGVLR